MKPRLMIVFHYGTKNLLRQRKDIFQEQWPQVEKLGGQVGQYFGKGTICVSNALQKDSSLTQYNHNSIPPEGEVATRNTA